MANINFPNNPSVNDEFLVGGKTYVWDGVKWVASTTITKADVGLGNVQNFSLANQSEAEAGSVDNKYMTPLRTAQAIAALESDTSTEFSAGVIETNASANTSIWVGTEAELPTALQEAILFEQDAGYFDLVSIQPNIPIAEKRIYIGNELALDNLIGQNGWSYNPNDYDSFFAINLVKSGVGGYLELYLTPSDSINTSSIYAINDVTELGVKITELQDLVQYDPNTLYFIEEE